MSKKKSPTLMAALVLAVLPLAGCGEDLGLCVSTAVDGASGLRVYCYDNNWTQAECAEYNDETVNGADWFFHANQTCEDRDLVEGGNDWP